MIAAAIAASMPLHSVGHQSASAAETLPNILIIVTDDQRATPLGPYMPQTHRWLGRQGTRFTNAFTAVPNCCPARASLFTGQYAHNHGVLNNSQGYLLPHDETIQYRLKQAGYRTALFGKYLNGWHINWAPPYFDSFSFFHGGYHDTEWNIDGTVRSLTRHSTSVIQDHATRFISDVESADEDPWFLYLAPYSPHSPYVVQGEYWWRPIPSWNGNPAVFEDDLSDKPPLVRDRKRFTYEQGRYVQGRQARMLLAVDDFVAHIRDVLEATRELRDTLVIFTSDNGMMWGEHGLGSPTFGKRFPYTESTKVPLYVRWRGHLNEGAIHQGMVSNVDIAPTIMDAIGLTHDPDLPMDGRSLLRPIDDREILIEYFRDARFGSEVPPWASLRSLDAQYVEYFEDDLATVSFREFYDLLNDPWQLSNLLSDGNLFNDSVADDHVERLTDARGCHGSDCP